MKELDKHKPLQEQLEKVKNILMHGNLEAVKKLAARQDFLAIKLQGGNVSNNWLSLTVINKDPTVTEYLIDTFKLNIDPISGITPLLEAAHHGNYNVIKLLIEKYHADITRKDKFGWDVVKILELKHNDKLAENVQKLLDKNLSQKMQDDPQKETSLETIKQRKPKTIFSLFSPLSQNSSAERPLLSKESNTDFTQKNKKNH